MSLSHADVLDCIARINQRAEVKVLTHEEIAAHTAAYLARGCEIGHPVAEPIRCASTSYSGTGSSTRVYVNHPTRESDLLNCSAWRKKNRRA